jgi:phosphatidylserine/phosphatidylglycerophosphate/cardiolipin synthase-like enzyme
MPTDTYGLKPEDSRGGRNPTAENFFLSGGSEPGGDTNFLAPPRNNVLVKPLVDAVETFASMEEAIYGAKKSVYLAFWVFNPRTPVQSDILKKIFRTWEDLLFIVASRGVAVRVLLTDFDPILGDYNHRRNWNAYRKLVNRAKHLAKSKWDLLQVICSLHPATVLLASRIVTIGLGKKLHDKLDAHVNLLNSMRKNDEKNKQTEALETFLNWPGLWSLVEYQEKKKVFTRRKDLNLFSYPASHHQKLCIVDETTAYCGGLDVDPYRIARRKHTSERHVWHDVDVKVQGTAALDICRNFIGRWNEEVPLFTEAIKRINSFSSAAPMVLHIANSDLKLNSMKPPAAGKAIVQIQRTRSVESRISPVPKTVQDDIARGYQKAIDQAKHFIYIENQYVRLPELGNWIMYRAKKVPDLRVLIVVPVAPEEVGQTGRGDEITELGLDLQKQLFTALRAALKDRVGIYSLIQAKKWDKEKDSGSMAIFGSPQIYVHSKLLLIDDLYANIGSPNANPRSFYVDTEISVAWFEPLEVQKLRLSLWKDYLGGAAGLPSWKPKDFIKEWNKIAIANERAAIEKRRGFIIRHDETKFPGAKHRLIPDEFASIFDTETGVTHEEGQVLA